MRKCPACEHVHDSLPISGWLVYGKATLLSNTEEETLAALVPMLTINEAGFIKHAQAECGVCSYFGSLDSFSEVHTCFFTQKPATHNGTLFDRVIWYSGEVAEDVRQLQEVRLTQDIAALLA